MAVQGKRKATAPTKGKPTKDRAPKVDEPVDTSDQEMLDEPEEDHQLDEEEEQEEEQEEGEEEASAEPPIKKQKSADGKWTFAHNSLL